MELGPHAQGTIQKDRQKAVYKQLARSKGARRVSPHSARLSQEGRIGETVAKTHTNITHWGISEPVEHIGTFFEGIRKTQP